MQILRRSSPREGLIRANGTLWCPGLDACPGGAGGPLRRSEGRRSGVRLRHPSTSMLLHCPASPATLVCLSAFRRDVSAPEGTHEIAESGPGRATTAAHARAANAGKIGTPRRGPQTDVCKFPGAAALGKASYVPTALCGVQAWTACPGGAGGPLRRSEGRRSGVRLRHPSTSMLLHCPASPATLVCLSAFRGDVSAPEGTHEIAESGPGRATTAAHARADPDN